MKLPDPITSEWLAKGGEHVRKDYALAIAGVGYILESMTPDERATANALGFWDFAAHDLEQLEDMSREWARMLRSHAKPVELLMSPAGMGAIGTYNRLAKSAQRKAAAFARHARHAVAGATAEQSADLDRLGGLSRSMDALAQHVDNAEDNVVLLIMAAAKFCADGIDLPDVPEPAVIGHRPGSIETQYDAKKWLTWADLTGSQPADDSLIEGVELVNQHWGGLRLRGENSSTVARNITIRDFFYHHGRKWGSRSYRSQLNILWEHCTFEDNRDEHAIYHNMAGMNGEDWSEGDVSLGVYNSAFRRIDSQLAQIEGAAYGSRTEETPDPEADATAGPPIVFRDVYGEDIGQAVHNGNIDSARPAYSLSFFAGCGMHDVELERVTIDNSRMPESTGALLSQRRDRLTLRDCVYRYPNGNRSIAQIDRNKVVEIRGGAWSGDRPIDLINCDRVLIEDVSGDVQVRRVTEDENGKVLKKETLGRVGERIEYSAA